MAGEVILVIDDEATQREALAGYLKKQGFSVLEADNGRVGMEVLAAQRVDMVITDLRMPEADGMEVLAAARRTNPDIEVVLMTAYASVGGAVDAMREGACHYLEKPIDLDDLDAVIARALESHYRVSENTLLRERLAGQAQFGGIIASDPAMEEALNIVARAAPSRATVLVRGESGTGKELVARAVHQASPRADKSFVAINCAALNENLIESELFGHEKGAFSGASERRIGRFEQADGGTLFIDELAEIPGEVQVKLLRVLQERRIERVGSGQSLDVDVRLIAATHRDLEQRVRDGSFREDLYYRLNVVSVALPALRQRRRDIPVLAEHFLAQYAQENGKEMREISKEAMDLLMRYDYPGNVRELQNILERAVVMARGDVLTRGELPPEVLQMGEVETTAHFDSTGGSLRYQVEELEKNAIVEALDKTGGVQSRAAETLGITERNLRYKLKKYGLK
ncbi:MAG: DNA-binding NtrC family response regulator [Candidatus Latescibacterota bacterium]|jgi:DNA-binding NtrC family response regulator